MVNVLYGILFAIGLVLLFFSIKCYQKTKDLLHSGKKTTAIVIDFIEVSDDDGTTYKSVFEYYDNHKEKHIFNSGVSTSPKSHKLGQKVKVVYDVTHDNVKLISFWGLYRWTIILLSIASPFLVIGFGYFLYHYN